MALQMFRKSVASVRMVDRKVSQSWRTRSSSALAMAMEMAMDMVVVFMMMNKLRDSSLFSSLPNPNLQPLFKMAFNWR